MSTSIEKPKVPEATVNRLPELTLLQLNCSAIALGLEFLYVKHTPF